MPGVISAIERVIGKQAAVRSRTYRCSSNAKLGLRVERELAEWYMIAEATKLTLYANGNRKPLIRMHRFTRAVVELLEKENMSLIHYQYPVGDKQKIHTKLDFVARDDRTGERVLIELKTGMDHHHKAKRSISLSNSEKMPDTPLSRAMLQAGIGGMLYEAMCDAQQKTLTSMWQTTSKLPIMHVKTRVAVIVVNNRSKKAKIHHHTAMWRHRIENLFSIINMS